VHDVEITLALLVAVAGLATAARLLGIPQPIFLLFGGLLLALSPAVPNVVLHPDLVFLLFLPPLLYIAAFETAVRDIRELLRSIVSLAVGLALATTLSVAWVVHLLLPEIGWPAAFALGAIVSPPDAIAAVAVLRRLSVPRRIVTLLEAESLFNDATALVTFRLAVIAMSTASFSLPSATLQFGMVAFGGIGIGLAVAAVIALVRRRVNDAPVEITISLLTPFATYLPAEHLGVSGVLATVTAGLAIGWWSPGIMDAEVRVRSRAVWDMLIFVLNGLVFLLIGLQISTILEQLAGRPLLLLAGMGALVSLTAILTRLIWVGLATAFSHWRGDPFRWPETLIVGWAGMRGVVSLATALALPLETPDRPLLLFLAFCVILATLVGQGLTLPWLIRALGVADDGSSAEQEAHARIVAVDAACGRISQLADEWPDHKPLVDTLKSQYGHRKTHLFEMQSLGDGSLAANGQPHEQGAEQELLEHRSIRRSVIDAERAAILGLRRTGDISDQVWRRVERDLDLEELRLEA
jgi:Na+/H+ antiporter